MAQFQSILRSFGLDLTPSRYQHDSIYTIAFHAKAGDHVVVRTVVKGKADVFWHHGIYLGNSRFTHMHPEGNISLVAIDTFMNVHSRTDTYVDSVGIIVYDKDSDAARAASTFTAVAAATNDEMKAFVYDIIGSNCECFATWCRYGKCEPLQCLPGVDSIAPLRDGHPKFGPFVQV